jgi:hypothetical protein
MIKEILAFLLESGSSESSTHVLETLNLQSSWITLLLTSQKHRSEIIQPSKQTRTTKNRYTNKNKVLKERKKDRARCYSQKNARNTENGARVEKI